MVAFLPILLGLLPIWLWTKKITVVLGIFGFIIGLGLVVLVQVAISEDVPAWGNNGGWLVIPDIAIGIVTVIAAIATAIYAGDELDT